jgi:hypothetical protein
MSDNKRMLYIVAGGAAFVGAAVLFYLLSGSKSESSASSVFDEIDALGAKQTTP